MVIPYAGICAGGRQQRRSLPRLLRHPEFAQWCGTKRTADWHQRFRATVVVSRVSEFWPDLQEFRR